MSVIQFDYEELETLSSEAAKLKDRVENLETIVNTKFNTVKNQSLFLNGFSTIKSFLDTKKMNVDTFNTRLNEYRDGMKNIENTYISKFNDIKLPKFEASQYTLSDNDLINFEEPLIKVEVEVGKIIDNDSQISDITIENSTLSTQKVEIENINNGSNNSVSDNNNQPSRANLNINNRPVNNQSIPVQNNQEVAPIESTPVPEIDNENTISEAVDDVGDNNIDVSDLVNVTNSIPSTGHIQYNNQVEEFTNTANEEIIPQQQGNVQTANTPKEVKSSSAFGIAAGLVGAAAGIAGAVGMAKKSEDLKKEKSTETNEESNDDKVGEHKWLIE